MARIARPAKRQEREDRFAGFDRLGLPMGQLCEAEGVKPATFWYWRWNLAGNATPRTKLSPKPEVAVTPVDVISPPPAAPIVSGCHTTLRLSYRVIGLTFWRQHL